MRYIPFNDVYTADYAIDRVVAFTQSWSDAKGFQTSESGRPNSGLMLVMNMENHITCNRKTVCAKSGQIVYLPQGLAYRCTFKTNQQGAEMGCAFTNYLVNFNVRDRKGNPMALSDEIVILTPQDKDYFIQSADYLVQKCKNAAFPPALLKATVYEMLTEMSKQIRGKSEKNAYDMALLPVKEYVAEHCFEEEIDMSQLCKIAHVSLSTLWRMFRENTGMSPKDYINSLRIARAKLLLKTGTLSVSDVAAQTGFSDVSYFVRFFKKKTGKTPKRYGA